MSYQSLFEKLENSDLILTANARLARYLTQQWVIFKTGIVEKPNIYSWKDYFLNLYEQKSWLKLNGSEDFPRILNKAESEYLWQEIIKNSSYELGLIQPEATAKSVSRAYEILMDWDLSLLDLENYLENLHSPEVRIFLDWSKEFEKKCQELSGVLNPEIKLPERIKKVYLIGFEEELSPRMKISLKKWESQGCEIENFEFSPKAQCSVMACQSRQDEWNQLAKMAKYYADQNLTVGVIVPEIVSYRSDILKSFFYYFEPEKLTQTHPIPENFAMTGGEPLATVPLIFEGLEYLKNPEGLLIFNLPSWRQFFLGELNKNNWPGEFTLTSFEHQAVMKFYEQIEAWLSLSFLLGECDFKTAKQSLQNWMDNVFFQPKSESEVLVNIYGPLEVSGLIQDVLLIANMNESSFPSQAKPNPYLPYELQKKLNMPHATAKRELNFASAQLKEWQGLCDELIAFYAEREGDLELRVSPLVQSWNVFSHDSPVGADLRVRPFSHANPIENPIENLIEPLGPPISLIELSNLTSGVNIFKSQAACPFQAFAKHRLNLKPIEPPIEPLNLKSRGIITHRILEKLMPEIIKISNWKIQPLENFQKLISEIVQENLSYLEKKEPESLPKFLKILEQERLIDLMGSWIELEKSREDFELLAQEREIFGVLADIPIRARIDRIDQMGNIKIIIDYKTGRAALNNCLGDRPDEPQLPIYALLIQADSVGYASINIQNLGLDCLDPELFKSYLAGWSESFKKLSEEFKQGLAVLNPKKGDSTCSRCDFSRLCRRHDRSGLFEGESE